MKPNYHFCRQFLILVFMVCVFVITGCQSAPQNTHKDFSDKVTSFVLDNGMRVLLVKRQGAPVFSALVRVKTGNVEELTGATGLAHFFEHMAFKGTDTIGTTDFAKEKPVLDEIYRVGTQMVLLKQQGKETSDEYKTLSEELQKLQQQEKKYIVRNEFINLFQQNGGSTINARTGNDFTYYSVSLPASKLELWAYLESSRWTKPVMREFFTEVGVVAEERRQRVDDDPNGLLAELFLKTAFPHSPYGVMVIGKPEDIQAYTPEKAKRFFDEYYTPSRTVLTVVGNFDVAQAKEIIQKYFGAIPKKQDKTTRDYEQEFQLKDFPKQVILNRTEQPRFYLGYHRPSYKASDDLVFDFIQRLLCDGRTSRLYKKLVLEEKKASGVACDSAFPGIRLNTLFLFYAMPHEAYSVEQLKAELLSEIKFLANEGPSSEEMQMIKNSYDADMVYSLQTNAGLASKMSFFESLTGSWKDLYQDQEKFHAITADDIKRVASTYFVPEREVMASLQKQALEENAQAEPDQRYEP